jgi:hypothetical protein
LRSIASSTGLKEGDNIETVCGELRNMFEHFRAMNTTKAHCITSTIAATFSKTGARPADSKRILSR